VIPTHTLAVQLSKHRVIVIGYSFTFYCVAFEGGRGKAILLSGRMKLSRYQKFILVSRIIYSF